MRIPLSVPDIGDAEQIELAAWRIEPGAQVNADQELCELVTDKAAFPLESPHAGKIVSIEKPAGSHVKVGEVLAYLERE
ncbi:MAG: lipoyl domain-containing protein [Leptospirales bacterium]|nr:lipoyl domain-containing protein [Leptospirales bacterium]